MDECWGSASAPMEKIYRGKKIIALSPWMSIVSDIYSGKKIYSRIIVHSILQPEGSYI
jgi:hypothetical protein